MPGPTILRSTSTPPAHSPAPSAGSPLGGEPGPPPPLSRQLTARAVALRLTSLVRASPGETDFDCPAEQPTPIRQFVNRLCKKIPLPAEYFILALFVVERRLTKADALLVTDRNVCAVYLTALVLATKYLEDTRCVRNQYFAKAAGLGIGQSRMNAMELTMLDMVKFRVGATADDFEDYLRDLLMTSAPPTS